MINALLKGVKNCPCGRPHNCDIQSVIIKPGAIDALGSLCLANTRYLLVEMPYGTWSRRMVQEVCDLPVQQGVIPVLAHVDRYRGLGQFNKYRHQLADSEVLFQCNAEAFERSLSCRWALNLIKEGFIDFLGSDCHNLTTRAPKLDMATEIIKKKAGAEALAQLAETAAGWLHDE